MDSYTPPVITEAENLPDYNRRGNAIRTLIADVDKRLYRLSGDTAAEKSRLEAEHAELTRRKLESDAVLAKEQTLADTKKRIAELQTEQRKAAAEVEQMDRLIAMCEGVYTLPRAGHHRERQQQVPPDALAAVH